MSVERTEFAKSLYLLARECGKELNDDLMALYSRALEPMGYDEASHAVRFILMSRRSNEPFPTPREIMDAIPHDEQMSPDEIANRMCGAIAKFGSYNAKDAEAYIGAIGWKIIRDGGGWSNLCLHMRPDQMPTVRAQWRKQIEAAQSRERTMRLIETTRKALNVKPTGLIPHYAK